MIIDGNAISNELLEDYRQRITTLPGRPPCLAVVLVGDNSASHVYINLKTKACNRIGIKSEKILLPSTCSEEQLLETIHNLNQDPNVDGILVQMPLPAQIDPIMITSAIDPEKDIDGFHPINVGKLTLGDPSGFVPCTPLGVMELLKHGKVDLKGLHAVVVGRSNIVGKPMGLLLLAANATVTTVHSKTTDLAATCRLADVLVAAIGKPNLITADMVKPGAVVIDVGVNKIADPSNKSGYRLVGDVDFVEISKKARAITPVPGGVGPMTIAMLMYNTIRSYTNRCNVSLFS